MDILQAIIDGFNEIIGTISNIINSIQTISTSIIQVIPYEIKTVIVTFLPLFMCLIFFKLYGKVKGN